MEFVLTKMETQLEDPIHYFLRTPDTKIALHPFLGKQISFHFTGRTFAALVKRRSTKRLAKAFASVVSLVLLQQALAFYDLSFAKRILALAATRSTKKSTTTSLIWCT